MRQAKRYYPKSAPCRFPTNWAIVTSERPIAWNQASYDHFGVGKRHCRVLNSPVVNADMRSGYESFWSRETALPCPQ
ncbi:hypothetical protein QUA35_18645 [Microcoleus sp. N9_B2]|uniref:hypothetical protein n=1 Tax=unclassified Microcoleus TaxID=2642155 RepID=UPI002FCEE893